MRLRLIAAAVLLSACQLTLPGQAPEPAAVSPITGGEVSVTALDDPDAVVEAAAPVTAPAEPAPGPEPERQVLAAEPAAPQAAPPPAAKSASQLACEKRGANWVVAGTTGTMICQTRQPDAGKACSRESDCKGQCLARSRSCAPVTPLFGCNEVLQNNGQRVTLCIE